MLVVLFQMYAWLVRPWPGTTPPTTIVPSGVTALALAEILLVGPAKT